MNLPKIEDDFKALDSVLPLRKQIFNSTLNSIKLAEIIVRIAVIYHTVQMS